MAPFPAPETGILLTHFVVSEDVARSRDFYADVLGGEVVSESPAVVALANSWIIINAGGGPTDDKPTVTLTAPDPASRPRRRAALLPARSRRAPHRGRPVEP